MKTAQEHEAEEVVRGFIRAVEAGAVAETLTRFLHPEVTQREWPNPFAPQGKLHDLASMQAAALRGAKVVRDQRYDVANLFAKDEDVVAEIAWSAALNVDTPKYPAGHTLRAHIAMFFKVRDGKIHRITNYDCYEP